MKQCQIAVIVFTLYLLLVKYREKAISRRFWSLSIFRILAVNTKTSTNTDLSDSLY